MHLYGVTEADMNADLETLSESDLELLFMVEFGGDVGCEHSSGEWFYSDGKNVRFCPDNVTDENMYELMRECLRTKRNLFLKQWKKRLRYKKNVDY